MVPHGKLVSKLERVGLHPFIVRWVCSYLQRRKQFVEINSSCSEILDVTSGVTQGSVLGPLLFLIYINDIVSAPHPSVNIRLFADDCVLFKEISSPDDQQLMSASLNDIQSWCCTWDMKLNFEKNCLSANYK